MQSELSRSRFAQETLEQSTAALADLGEKYSDLNTLLANSKNLVTTLLKSQKSDTWYLETTFYILITTIVWLVFRRWLYGPLTWFVFWPIKLVFRVLFGVASIGSAAASTTSLAASSSSLSSSSLIVQPSATGGIPRRDPNSHAQPQGIRVGGGGRGYAKDPSLDDSLSQHVGRMAEQQQEEQQQQQQREEEEAMLNHPQLRQQPQQPDNKGPVVRSDGTVLKESDKPRNPKKKMWEEDVEREKHEQAQQGQQGGSRERDEL